MLLAHDHSELDAALAAFCSALGAGDVEQSLRNLDLFWARLAMHIRAENLHLFPALLDASETASRRAGVPAQETVQEIINRLRADHDFFMSELAVGMKQLRELRRAERHDATPVLAKVREQMSRVRSRIEAHNDLEESQVYHWAGAFLDASEQNALNEKLQRELNNLPSRFRGLKKSNENNQDAMT
ncbi:MAG TPA: hemerythrin domain-containing protein [Candidatus Udaeobacter sp.]|nr:hemerythrin domain-containing protein [Candidatus Udaeobacter sp.]